jgi:hypothetical protein
MNRFVDIGAIADHHCLDFLAVINKQLKKPAHVRFRTKETTYYHRNE